jgi:hypothetical protein
MAAPLAAAASKVAKKLIFDVLTDPEKVLKYIIIFVILPVILLLLIFAAPIAAITSLPTTFFYSDNSTQTDIMAQTAIINNYKMLTQNAYDDGIKWVKNEEQSLQPYDDLVETKSFTLSWMDLMAIDSIRYNQDFTNVTSSEIETLIQGFITKKAYKETYQVYDSNGKVETKIRAVIIFSTAPFSSMLSSLGFSDNDKAIASNIDRTLIGLVDFQNSGQPNVTYSLAYADAVTSALAGNANISQILMLALISHESGGDWLATNQNSNGTTDAGLCQINSANWGKYGLTNNPYDVSLNLAASISILNSDIQMYKDEVDALYAYNGGTPDNGKEYNPSYATDIEAIKAQLESSDVYTTITYTQIPGRPIVLIASERNNQNFYNPPNITVTDNRTGEEETILKTNGDSNVWAPQAAIYPLDLSGNLNDLSKGDTLTINFPDGKSSSVTVTKDL